MEDRRNIFNRPIALLGFMISVKNQNPLSRSGLKMVSRKSRDIQSPSQRRCELKSADSRAVTKRRLFDCEPVYTADRMVSCKKLVSVWTDFRSQIRMFMVLLIV